jgi:cytoplasmic iron level regulating protein YaaA (DUF328/UPF0246 family)
VARVEVVVLIPESTRKRSGGSPDSPTGDTVEGELPTTERQELEALRQKVLQEAPRGSVDAGRYLAAYERFDGNMYRSIPREAWEQGSSAVEVVIASALRGLVASRDPIPLYHLSMAESTPPFGKLNRWWHQAGLPRILSAYLRAVRPKSVVDLLSLEYRESVAGYENRVPGIAVRPIDFPGMGRASQPRRGEKVAEILRSGKA